MKHRYIFRILSLLFICLILMSVNTAVVSAAPTAQQENPTVVYFFWGDGCPHCAEAEPFLKDLTKRYPSVRVLDFEVWYNPENRMLFEQMAVAYGYDSRFVPTFFIGEQYWVGFNDDLRQQIEAATLACVENGCIDAGAGVIPDNDGETGDSSGSLDLNTPPRSSSYVITLPWVGKVDLGAQSLWASTALIGLWTVSTPALCGCSPF